MISGIILDLDGTVYCGDEEIPGAGDFIRRLEDAGIGYLFVTNRANRPAQDVSDQLEGYGIPCTPDHVLTVSRATAQYLEPGSSAYCIGEEGLTLEMEAAGITLTEDQPDAVVVSFDRFFTYDKMDKACQFIRGGAKYVATNPDKNLKLPDRVAPGTGSIVAAVSMASDATPVFVGKPERLIMDMAVEKLDVAREEVIAVGDFIGTDIAAGHAAGLRTALILTGISTREDVEASDIKPTWIVEDYEELWEIVEGG